MNITLGRLIHFGFDAVLLSGAIAGIRRTTGVTAKSDKIENESLRSAVEKYLNTGEWLMDRGGDFLNSTGYFEKRPPGVFGGKPPK